MATSSIFASFDITEPEAAEPFVAALEESEERERNAPPITIYPVMDDLDEIRAFVARRKSSQNSELNVLTSLRLTSYTVSREIAPLCKTHRRGRDDKPAPSGRDGDL